MWKKYEHLKNKNEVYELYYNKTLKNDINMKEYIRNNIFIDANDKTIDMIYEFIMREIILKLLFENNLNVNKILNLNLNYKTLPKSVNIVVKQKSKSPEVSSYVKQKSKSPKKFSLSPDLKKSEKLKNIDDLASDMITKGNKDKLLGNKIKKQTAINFIIKLLENMKKSFYKMLDKDNTILTNNNRKFFITKFFTDNINNRIDDIGNTLINSCLSSMKLENSRIWLNKYLPIYFNQIV